jgi:hypothetical protein
MFIHLLHYSHGAFQNTQEKLNEIYTYLNYDNTSNFSWGIAETGLMGELPLIVPTFTYRPIK